jgi:Zn-finger domain-containing protein
MFVSTRFIDMERSEWMYQIKRMEPQYLVHVKKLVVAVKAHRLSLGQMTTICLCSKCKNMKAHVDSEVKSHLIKFGFINDYTV